MKNEKFDARSQNTLVAIRSSILELLQKKRLQEITIAEVCRSAHINRGTFYHHYFDIYDAYESIEDEFFEEISVRLSSVDVSRLELSFFQEILEFISEHCAFTLFIYTNNGKNSLLTRLIDYVKNKYSAIIPHAFRNSREHGSKKLLPTGSTVRWRSSSIGSRAALSKKQGFLPPKSCVSTNMS